MITKFDKKLRLLESSKAFQSNEEILTFHVMLQATYHCSTASSENLQAVVVLVKV